VKACTCVSGYKGGGRGPCVSEAAVAAGNDKKKDEAAAGAQREEQEKREKDQCTDLAVPPLPPHPSKHSPSNLRQACVLCHATDLSHLTRLLAPVGVPGSDDCFRCKQMAVLCPMKEDFPNATRGTCVESFNDCFAGNQVPCPPERGPVSPTLAFPPCTPASPCVVSLHHTLHHTGCHNASRSHGATHQGARPTVPPCTRVMPSCRHVSCPGQPTTLPAVLQNQPPYPPS
jgi:hypothetical protein